MNLLSIPQNYKTLTLAYSVRNVTQPPLIFSGAEIISFENITFERDTTEHATTAGDVQVVYDTLKIPAPITFELWVKPDIASRLMKVFTNNISNSSVTMGLAYDVDSAGTPANVQYIFSGFFTKVEPPKTNFQSTNSVVISLAAQTVIHKINGVEQFKYIIRDKRMR